MVNCYMDKMMEAVPFLTAALAMLLMVRLRSGSSCAASGSEAVRMPAMMMGTQELNVPVAAFRLFAPTLLLALIDSSMALVTLVTLLGLSP